MTDPVLVIKFNRDMTDLDDYNIMQGLEHFLKDILKYKNDEYSNIYKPENNKDCYILYLDNQYDLNDTDTDKFNEYTNRIMTTFKDCIIHNENPEELFIKNIYYTTKICNQYDIRKSIFKLNY